MEIFAPAPHHDTLALIVQLSILLFTAKFFGEIALRMKQPSVVGEILAGIILGPSILGYILPSSIGLITPGNETQWHLLEAFSLVGAMFLLLITGLETDLNLIRRHARTALGVSGCGILVTFVTGFFLGQNLPESLLADPSQRLVFSLFIATAMSISAIPVIAKVLIDLKMTRRDIGQTIIAAGMSDDTVGWILLSIVTGLAGGAAFNPASAAKSVLIVAAFLVGAFTFGRWLTRISVNLVQDHSITHDRLLTLTVVFMFAFGAVSHALHIEPVLGAFVFGIILSNTPRLPEAVHTKLESITLGIFAPIFFAVAGLKVNILNVLTPSLFGIALLIIAVATFGKIIGTYIGARFIGRVSHWNALSFGAALNARGAMEIIIATIGLSLGILSQDMFSLIVVMAISTSLMAPTALRWVLTHVQPSEEENKRLEKEELTEGSPIEHIHRVLVPIRRHDDNDHLRMVQIIKSRLLHEISRTADLSVTLMSIEPKEKTENNSVFLKMLSMLFKDQEVVLKHVNSPKPGKAILDEVQKDYDLLVLGASQESTHGRHLFSHVVDSLIRLSPCMTMVVHANQIAKDWDPKRILIPTNGSIASKHAAELAFILADGAKGDVTLLNIIEHKDLSLEGMLHRNSEERQKLIAEKTLNDLAKFGTLRNIHAKTLIRVSENMGKEILNTAVADNYDLLILGTDVRAASGHLYLGPRVEQILRNSSIPVVILNTPS